MKAYVTRRTDLRQMPQDERILNWLKKKGYAELIQAYHKELTHDTDQDQTIDSLFRSLQESDASVYHNSYSELQTWISAALEAYKPELLSLSFPIFVHCYIALVNIKQCEEAKNFFHTWSPEHADSYQQELQSISTYQKAEQLQRDSYVHWVLHDRFIISLCTISYRLLQSFLSSHNLLLIMGILNERVRVIVEDRAPRDRFQVVHLMGETMSDYLPSRRRPDHRPTVRWRTEWAPLDSATQAVRTTTPDESASTYNSDLFKKLKVTPTKYLGREVEKRGAGDALNPTCLMATVTNTYDGLITAKITEDATQLATGYQDRAVRVFRLAQDAGIPGPLRLHEKPRRLEDPPQLEENENGRPITLQGHSQPVYGLSWSPTQRHLLSSAGDGTVRLWEVAYGRCAAVYRNPTGLPIWDVAFCPLGYYFVTGGYDRTAKLWCTEQVTPQRVFAGHYSDVSCVCWHPNCNYIVTGSWDKTARLFDVQSGRCVRVFTGLSGPLSALAVSPDGQYVAGAANIKASTGSIRLWEISSGKDVAVLSGHVGGVHRLAFDAEGLVFASAGADNTVRTWDIDGDFESLSQSITLHAHCTFTSKSGPVLEVNWTKNHLLLACGPT